MTTLSSWNDEIAICLEGENLGRRSEDKTQEFNFKYINFEMPSRHSCDNAKWVAEYTSMELKNMS